MNDVSLERPHRRCGNPSACSLAARYLCIAKLVSKCKHCVAELIPFSAGWHYTPAVLLHALHQVHVYSLDHS
jgi:hypothetical protein